MIELPNQNFISEEDEDFLYSCINDKIEGIFGDNASQSEKQELLDSLFSIFNKYMETTLLQEMHDGNQGFFTPNINRFINPQAPFINLYLPPNFGNNLIPNFYQQPPTIIPGALQPPVFQPPQLYQQPNILLYGQPYPQLTTLPKSNKKEETKKHKKSKKQKKDKHSHKKHKKSSEKVESKAKKSGAVAFLTHDPSKEFQGIIRYLVDNPLTSSKKVINITSSSTFDNSMKETNVLIFNNDRSYFSSNDVSNSWICFDFTDYRVTPNSYTVKSIPYPEGNYHPKSWVIEASNDKMDWDILDRQDENQRLNGNCLVFTFEMANKSKKRFRYVRMRQTAQNCGGNNYLEINNFEIYGYLYKAE